MTLYAILVAIAAIVGAFFGLRRKAAKERDARVRAEIDRDQARGERDVAEATVAVTAEVDARKDTAVVVGEDFKAEVAAIAAAAHAATPAAGVPTEPTPAEVVRAADEARRDARTRTKIAKGRKGGK